MSGLTAIFVMKGSGNDKMYYLLSDHLGSMSTIVNAATSEVENYSYNAWGMPRDASDWTQSLSGDLFADRGYTGHEHLTEFNLINMNGRIYDPILSRYLSPDPYVQAPGDPNNYNRYTYCLNNPLKYTDPSVYFYNPDDYVPPDPKGIGPNGEFQYLFFGTNRGDPGNTAGYGSSFGEKMYYTSSFRPGEAGPTYDYVYNWSTGQYDEFYGSGSLSQSDWSSSSLSQMGYKGRTASSLTDAYNQLGYVTTVFGTDALGNQDVGVLNTTTDHMTVYKIPFWEITGSYYNYDYFMSGVKAYGDINFMMRIIASKADELNFLPVGFSWELNGSVEGGVASSLSLWGGYLSIRNGVKFRSFGSAGGGIGGVGVSGQLMKMTYFYFGDIKQYNSNMLAGPSWDLDYTIGIPGSGPTPVGGGSVSLIFNPNPAAAGDFMIGIGNSFGVGIAPTAFSASGTYQITWFY